jgi:hypothetical protein
MSWHILHRSCLNLSPIALKYRPKYPYSLRWITSGTLIPYSPSYDNPTGAPLDTINPESAEMPVAGKHLRFPTRQASCIYSSTDAKANGTRATRAEPDTEGNPMPPNLEELIPGRRLPDIIEVYVDQAFLFRASGREEYLNQSTELEWPIKFVRRYPSLGRFIDGKGMFNTPS